MAHKKLPLYTAVSKGVRDDGLTPYEMIIITQWSDNTRQAEEVGHKCYYIQYNPRFLNVLIHNEQKCEEIYKQYEDNSKILINEL